MIKLKEIYKIGITTNYSDLPSKVADCVYIGGPGFIVNRDSSFSWGDYIVVDEDNKVSGMTKQHVSSILSNAAVIINYDQSKKGN